VTVVLDYNPASLDQQHTMQVVAVAVDLVLPAFHQAQVDQAVVVQVVTAMLLMAQPILEVAVAVAVSMEACQAVMADQAWVYYAC
jgi:hypothetical protein